MKVKLLLTLTLFATATLSSAVKVRPAVNRHAEKRAFKEARAEHNQPAESKAEHIAVDEHSSAAQSAPIAERRRKSSHSSKDLHKRGIYGFGGLGYGPHAAHGSSVYWPKSYAAHYGYSLNFPGASAYSNVATHGHGHAYAAHAHIPTLIQGPAYAAHAPVYAAHPPAYAGHAHAPTFFKYPIATSSYHLKHFGAAHAAIPIGAYGGGGGGAVDLGAAHGFSAPAVVSSVAPVSPSYVLRPGGAVVSSYNVNYPRVHHKPLIAVQPTVAHVQPVQAVQSVAAVAPLQPVQPVEPLQPLQPVQPVHSVVQVQHTPQFFASVQPQHHLPHYFQTNFVQPQRPPIAVPAAPIQPVPAAIPAVPLSPSLPAVPSFPTAPAFASFPTFPTAPAVPAIPTAPAVPATPAVPTAPTAVNLPARPPPSATFPIGVQPPTQQTPAFVSIPLQPEAQFPPLGPVPGSPQRPQSGSAEASPQIPNFQPHQPTPAPHQPQRPELPAVQGTEEPWRPIISYGPPSVDRPANTLLPPHSSSSAGSFGSSGGSFSSSGGNFGSSGGSFGSAPGEAYLPPTASSNQQHYQQQQATLLDNLTDAEIEHIFAQAANLAAQNTPHRHQHRTFSQY